ncbi:uncharacterized protein LOC143923871 [Lithobates pipiens]
MQDSYVCAIRLVSPTGIQSPFLLCMRVARRISFLSILDIVIYLWQLLIPKYGFRLSNVDPISERQNNNKKIQKRGVLPVLKKQIDQSDSNLSTMAETKERSKDVRDKIVDLH